MERQTRVSKVELSLPSIWQITWVALCNLLWVCKLCVWYSIAICTVVFQTYRFGCFEDPWWNWLQVTSSVQCPRNMERSQRNCSNCSCLFLVVSCKMMSKTGWLCSFSCLQSAGIVPDHIYTCTTEIRIKTVLLVCSALLSLQLISLMTGALSSHFLCTLFLVWLSIKGVAKVLQYFEVVTLPAANLESLQPY